MTENAPILIVNTEANMPVWVKEQLIVYENGRSYLHIQSAANPQYRNQAGTYMIQLDEPSIETAKNIISDLLILAPQADRLFPDGSRRSITVNKDGNSQSHLLPAQVLAKISPALKKAVVWVNELTAQLHSAPLAVVALRAKVKSMPNELPILLLTCENLGKEAVNFLFRPESLSVLAESGQAIVPIWQNSQPERSGLIDGSGNLVDGVFTAAQLEPGRSATAVYSQTSPAIQSSMQVQLAGWIELYRMERETAVTPQDNMRLVTQLTD